MDRQCAIAGCEKPLHCRGWCWTQYERWRAHGDPLVSLVLTGLSVSERLARRSVRNGDCIEWIGYRGARGYGYLSVDGVRKSAHRASYEVAHGSIPDGLVVRHSCDNPPCINPAHLCVGTHAENVGDALARNRTTKGERHGLARLTEGQVMDIYERALSKTPYKKLAAEYGVKPRTIQAIRDGQTWGWLTRGASA